MKALLFINGIPPKNIPAAAGYSLVACTDGAFHYLKSKSFPLDQLDFISGDFDSHSGKDETIYHERFIYTPDQNKTDFEKALEIILSKGEKEIDVYGPSGGEMDHFLGNLTVAFQFKEELKITFFDEFSTYFFSPRNLVLKEVQGKMVSLYPFPTTKKVKTIGLNWELKDEDLDIMSKIGTRNRAINAEVQISFESGALVVFVGN